MQAADFNGLARELKKFVGDSGLNAEGLSGMDRYRQVLTRLWNGQSPNNAEKEKGIIIRTGDGLVGCGLDKIKVFQQCIMPPLKEFYTTANETVAPADIVSKLMARLQKEGVIIGSSL